MKIQLPNQTTQLADGARTLTGPETVPFVITASFVCFTESDFPFELNIPGVTAGWIKAQLGLSYGCVEGEAFTEFQIRNPATTGASEANAIEWQYGFGNIEDRRLNVVTTRPNQFVAFQDGKATVADGGDYTIAPWGTAAVAGFGGVATSAHGRRKTLIVCNESPTLPVYLLRLVGATYLRCLAVQPQTSIEVPGNVRYYVNSGGASAIRAQVHSIYYDDGKDGSNIETRPALVKPEIASIVWEYGMTAAGLFDAVVTWTWPIQGWPTGTVFHFSGQDEETPTTAADGPDFTPAADFGSIVTRYNEVTDAPGSDWHLYLHALTPQADAGVSEAGRSFALLDAPAITAVTAVAGTSCEVSLSAPLTCDGLWIKFYFTKDANLDGPYSYWVEVVTAETGPMVITIDPSDLTAGNWHCVATVRSVQNGPEISLPSNSFAFVVT